jgi:hypothetical protein
MSALAEAPPAGRQASWSRLLQEPAPEVFLPAWVSLLCERVDGLTEVVLVLGPADQGPYAPVATWPHRTPCSKALQGLCEQALELRRAVSRTTAEGGKLALPVQRGDSLLGVLGVGVAAESGVSRVQRDWLYWGMGWLLAHPATQAPETPADELSERLLTLLDLLLVPLDEKTPREAYQAVLSQAALKLGCDRVALGLRRGRRVRLESLSQSAEIAARIDLSLALEATMDEALDQGCSIEYPPLPDTLNATHAHRALAEQHGNARILSVPFYAGDSGSGVFVFEWSAGGEPPPLDLAEALASMVGRVLLEKARANLSMTRFFWRWLMRSLGRLFGRRYLGRKLVLLSLIGLIGWGYFATGAFRISAEARLESSAYRVMAAPIDGFVAEALARAGQQVATGAVLARLDDRDLRLESTRWQSQRSRHEREMQLALARRDLAEAQVAEAQMLQAQSQLALINAMLERTAIVAPFDALIIAGDLSQDLGRPVRKGDVLFELAPVESYRVIVDILESDLAHVREGQSGWLVLKAFPERRMPVEISLITPVSEPGDGRTVFRAEARLDEQLSAMRPGMEGVVRVDAGEARLVWVWSRTLIDWTRLRLWNWFGI